MSNDLMPQHHHPYVFRILSHELMESVRLDLCTSIQPAFASPQACQRPLVLNISLKEADAVATVQNQLKWQRYLYDSDCVTCVPCMWVNVTPSFTRSCPEKQQQNPWLCYLLLACTGVAGAAICPTVKGDQMMGNILFLLLFFICLLMLPFGFCLAWGYSGLNPLFVLLDWGQKVFWRNDELQRCRGR